MPSTVFILSTSIGILGVFTNERAAHNWASGHTIVDYTLREFPLIM